MIKNLVQNANQGINNIKLRDLLSVQQEISSSPIIRSLMPPIEIGSITLVDQIVLLSLVKIIQPHTIIEIGTYLGYTTALFAMNTNAKIFTIDLAKVDQKSSQFNSNLILHDGDYNDDFLRAEQNTKGEVYLQYLNQEEKQKVCLIKADSTAIDFQSKFETAEFVFIDGGHERSIVEADTRNARSIINKGVIVWHDFGSGIHNDVTSFLMGEKGHKFFHVTGSLCAFELIGADET